MTCNNRYINPLDLEIDEDRTFEQEIGGDPTTEMGTGRRRKRSTVKRALRNKRQDSAPSEQGLSENVTLVSRATML